MTATALANRDLFLRDPLATRLPNDGVAKVVEPRSAEEWAVLRHELETFVCEGEYRRGLDRILGGFLGHLGRETQPAVWVSGFFGSGKSHLVRVLEYLWRDTPMPDGASARGIANLTDDVRVNLAELANRGRQYGGVWSAAGTLGSSAGGSVRLAFLEVIFRGAGLHEKYPQARFMLWLMREGLFDAVAEAMHQRGADLGRELTDMYVSSTLAAGLLAARPDFARDAREVGAALRAQFPPVKDISDEEMLTVLEDVLRLKATDPAKLPLTLVVLDELQQFVGPYADRAAQVQSVVETCASRLGSTLLFVATGQNALQDTEHLAKIQARFTVQVALSTTDVERVVRQVVLQKQPAHAAALAALLDRCSGEISKQLPGTRIGPTAEDAAHLAADYPLLPARQRFWERAVRAIDRSGVKAQLRGQLRIAHEAARSVADKPLGTVVGGDFVYGQIAADMVQTSMMLREDYETVQKLRDDTEGGGLRYRACATVYLIGKLAADGGADMGLRATTDTLADLLVTDLTVGGAYLRAHLPPVLYALVTDGTLAEVDGEYRLQTGEGRIWEGEYRSRASALRNDTARFHEERAKVLRERVGAELKGVAATQGASREKRGIELWYDANAPVGTGSVPVWVRDEWGGTVARVATEDAHRLGGDSPVVTVWLPRTESDTIRRELSGLLAARETLDTRGGTTGDSGAQARGAMETKLRRHREALNDALDAVLRDAKVFAGGGTEVPGLTLAAAVTAAADAAAVRLYPQFKEADHPGWAKAAERARKGEAESLESVGHAGDPAAHPVPKRVLDYAGMDGKSGKTIRAHFAAPQFGWPRETVDAALLALVAAGAMRAAQGSTTLSPKQLTATVIANADFRRESVAVTLPQRLQAGGVVQAMTGKPGTRDNDTILAVELRDALTRLRDLAASAGGAAPRPVPPNTATLDALLERVGNDLIVGVADAAVQLKADAAAWKAQRDAVATRLPRWHDLERLLAAADGLPVADTVRAQANAVRDGRGLLAEPNPVPSLCATLAAALRAALTEAHEGYTAAFAAEREKLAASEAWGQLPPGRGDALLVGRGIALAPKPALGTDAELLASLAQTPLAGWRDRTDALLQRFAQAMAEAVREVTPAAVKVALPSRTLATEAEVEAYLTEVRAALMVHVEAGKPVIT